jgi:spore coat protein A, manganese oxidase
MESLKSRIPNPKPLSDLKKLRWKTRIEYIPPISLDEDDTTRIHIAQKLDHVFFHSDFDNLPDIIRPVWGYGTDPKNVSSPGPTLEAIKDEVVKVEWINNLSNRAHHPFVEPPRELRSPGMISRYSVGHAVVHLHGAHVPWTSDGYSVRVSKGMGKNPLHKKTVLRPGQFETYVYPNSQPGGGTLWYHDHTMDMTSMNVYAGLAGAYLLRDKLESSLVSLPKREYEIPLIIQDRSFTENDELLYGDADFLTTYREADQITRDKFKTGEDPQPLPEFKGQVICVNGKIWPYLEVEPRPYRFRLINGSNSRLYVMRISNSDADNQPDTATFTTASTIYQIGADGGLLKDPVPLTGEISNTVPPVSSSKFLVLAPGERADVIIDFSTHPGQSVYLTNHAVEGTNSPFGNGGDNPIPGTTDGIIKFAVKNSPVVTLDLEQLKNDLILVSNTDRNQPDLSSEVPTVATRQYSITESNTIPLTPTSGSRGWTAITFQPDITLDTPGYLWGGLPPSPTGSVPNGGPFPDNGIPHQLGAKIELWEFYNVSPDVHPIHLHHSYMQLYARELLPTADPKALPTVIDDNEKGWKDTIRINPQQKTSILVRFDDGGDRKHDYTGHYVWHCHLPDCRTHLSGK